MPGNNQLIPNSETGFLESHRVNFDSDRKVQFLKLAKDFIETNHQYPLITGICKAIGISIKTFEYHLENDPVFKNAWKEVISILKDVYTSKLAVKADSKNGIVANLALLKFLETGSFVDRLQVNSNSNISTNKNIIDAVLINSDSEILQEYPITSTQSINQKQIDNSINQSASNRENKPLDTDQSDD